MSPHEEGQGERMFLYLSICQSKGVGPERTRLPSAGRFSLEQAQGPSGPQASAFKAFTSSARARSHDASLGVLFCLPRALGASPNHFPGSNITYWWLGFFGDEVTIKRRLVAPLSGSVGWSVVPHTNRLGI